MWLKILVCALLIAFSVCLGRFASSSYRSRSAFYAQFSSLNERYLNELAYSRRPLAEFLSNGGFSGDFSQVIESFQGGKVNLERCNYLTEEEKGEILDYFSMLGKGDSHSQMQFFSSRKQILTERKETCAQEAKKRGDLYLKLGLLAGLAAVILII